MTLHEAIRAAQSRGVDLVEVAPNATPPVCRLIDYGKFRYEKEKENKEARKHQHANKVKEVQLSPSIDPHDFGIKLNHSIDFLCEEMKVKVTLKFRGREMAHTEIGKATVDRFLADLAPYGHPDAQPKLQGRAITVMISPLPRNKRAKNPRQEDHHPAAVAERPSPAPMPRSTGAPASDDSGSGIAGKPSPSTFSNNPFTKLDLDVREDPPAESAGGG
jgi:translation initiation factor IF-3